MYIDILVGSERSTRSRLDPHSLDPQPRRNRKNRSAGFFFLGFGSESGKNTRNTQIWINGSVHKKKYFVAIEYFLIALQKSLNTQIY